MDPYIEWAVPILVFFSVVAVGGAVVTARAANRKAIRRRLLEADGPTLTHDETPAKPKSSLLGVMQSLGALLTPRGTSQRLKEQLAKAGYFGPASNTIFIGLKMTLFVAGLLIFTALVMPMAATFGVKLLLVVTGAACMSYLPNILLTSQRIHRTSLIRNHLPDAVDLLEVCVSSGMGLDTAWNSVADEIRGVCPMLADEMSLTNLESHLGAPRASAMRHMAERTGADELSSLAALLTQSERFGTSISDALRVFALSMRENRRQRAEEAAEKMAVKLLFPLVIFIFPPIIIVSVGSAGIRIAQIFSHGG